MIKKNKKNHLSQELLKRALPKISILISNNTLNIFCNIKKNHWWIRSLILMVHCTLKQLRGSSTGFVRSSSFLIVWNCLIVVNVILMDHMQRAELAMHVGNYPYLLGSWLRLWEKIGTMISYIKEKHHRDVRWRQKFLSSISPYMIRLNFVKNKQSILRFFLFHNITFFDDCIKYAYFFKFELVPEHRSRNNRSFIVLKHSSKCLNCLILLKKTA